eukprot:363314_1
MSDGHNLILLKKSSVNSNDNGNEHYILNNKYNSSQYIFYIKWGLYGGFQKKYCFICCILISLTIYLYSIGIALAQFVIQNGLCTPFELCYLAIQIQSFTLYILGIIALFRNVKIKQLYKPSPKLHIILISQILLPFISGFITLLDEKDWRLTDASHGKIMEIVSFCLDLLRYWQIVCIAIIFYGALNTFPDKMKQFDLNVVGNDNINGLLSSQYNPISLESLDHKIFMKEFNNMTMDYRVLLNRFKIFITVYSAFVAISWFLMIWTIVWQLTPSPCNVSGYWYYTHYALEIIFYCDLLLVIIWGLMRNHSLIVKYRNMFRIKTMIKHSDTQLIGERNIISNYLDTLVFYESPFRIFGVIPTPTKLFWCTTSIILPLTWQIYKVSTAGTNI